MNKTQNQSTFLLGSALRLSVWLIYDLSFKLFFRGKDWYTPAGISSMSGQERAYLIAGNLSAVYHQSQTPKGSVYVNNSNVLCVGKQPIVDLSPEKQPKEITQRLKQLL